MFSEVFIATQKNLYAVALYEMCKTYFLKIFEHENYPNYGTLVLGSGD